MGGGVEQLLVLATVLYTTDQRFSIAIEEPETHLHPGAQRFLIERLYDDERQVIIATHSSTLLNVAGPKSIFRIGMTEGLSSVSTVASAAELDQTLRDIGVRNSDVLMSDAAIFVEGQSDADVILALSVVVGFDLTQRNIGVVLIGSGERAAYAAPVASEALEALSAKAGVPHMFLLDRDERSPSDVEHLERQLPGRIRYLARRELENYLLAPRALIAALNSKYANERAILSRVTAMTEKDVLDVVANSADGLYSVVLAKRMRFALKPIARGIAPSELIDALIPLASQSDFPEGVMELMNRRVATQVRDFDIKGVASKVKADLDDEWSEPSKRPLLAPGEELIGAVFASVGGKYAKAQDAVTIARHFIRSEVAPELVEIITIIARLPNS